MVADMCNGGAMANIINDIPLPTRGEAKARLSIVWNEQHGNAAPPPPNPAELFRQHAEAQYFALYDIYDLLNRIVWGNALACPLLVFQDGKFANDFGLVVRNDGTPEIYVHVRSLASKGTFWKLCPDFLVVQLFLGTITIFCTANGIKPHYKDVNERISEEMGLNLADYHPKQGGVLDSVVAMVRHLRLNEKLSFVKTSRLIKGKETPCSVAFDDIVFQVKWLMNHGKIGNDTSALERPRIN